MSYFSNIFFIIAILAIAQVLAVDKKGDPECCNYDDDDCGPGHSCCCGGSGGGKDSCEPPPPPKVSGLGSVPKDGCYCVPDQGLVTCEGDGDCRDESTSCCCSHGNPKATCWMPHWAPRPVSQDRCYCIPNNEIGCGGGGKKNDCAAPKECCCYPPSRSKFDCSGRKWASLAKNIKYGSCECVGG